LPTPHDRYTGKLLTLLARVAREGSSGSLWLDRGMDPGPGRLAFSEGRVSALTFPAPAGTPAPDPLDPQATRAAFLRAIRIAAAEGSNPDFVPEAQPAVTDGAALSAADLALECARTVGDLESFRSVLLADAKSPLVRSSNALRCAPGASLGPSDRYVLARADGSMTRAAIVAASPAGEKATLQALYALEALGMVGSRPAAARAVAAQTTATSDLDSFLSKTSSANPRPAPAHRYSPEEEKEREDLTERFRSGAGKDAYSTLEVAPNAQESEIRAAYYRLAKRYHPDRLRKPHLEDMHRDIERMFASMTEAYNTLGNPESRQEYDRARQEVAAGRKKEAADPVAVARDAYLRGRREMDAGHTFEAIRLFEAASQSDPSRFEYFHFLGVCQGQNPRWRKKAEANLLQAISMNPSAPQAYVELARIYRKGGLERRALEMYEQALKWEPDHEEALEALGRAGGKDATSTGLLRSIFRKD